MRFLYWAGYDGSDGAGGIVGLHAEMFPAGADRIKTAIEAQVRTHSSSTIFCLKLNNVNHNFCKLSISSLVSIKTLSVLLLVLISIQF